jgi:DUF2975 family protein
MGNMTRIQRVSLRFRLLFTGLIFLIPTLDVLYWLSFNHLPDGLFKLPIVANVELPLQIRLLAMLASLLPVSVATFGVFTLVKLFKLYEKAIIFTVENVKHFRTLGYVVIYWVFAKIIYITLISAIISLSNPLGQRVLIVQFELPDISALIIGFIAVLISWIMDEGRKLEDEQAHTV